MVRALAVVPTSIDQLVSDPTLAHTLPPTVALSLIVALAARLARPDLAVAAPVTPVQRERPISMKKAAEQVGMPYDTFRKPKVRALFRACEFNDGGSRPKFIPSKLDAVIKSGGIGKPRADRLGFRR